MYGMGDWRTGGRYLVRRENFYVRHSVYTCCGPVHCGPGGSLPRVNPSEFRLTTHLHVGQC